MKRSSNIRRKNNRKYNNTRRKNVKINTRRNTRRNNRRNNKYQQGGSLLGNIESPPLKEGTFLKFGENLMYGIDEHNWNEESPKIINLWIEELMNGNIVTGKIRGRFPIKTIMGPVPRNVTHLFLIIWKQPKEENTSFFQSSCMDSAAAYGRRKLVSATGGGIAHPAILLINDDGSGSIIEFTSGSGVIMREYNGEIPFFPIIVSIPMKFHSIIYIGYASNEYKDNADEVIFPMFTSDKYNVLTRNCQHFTTHYIHEFFKYASSDKERINYLNSEYIKQGIQQSPLCFENACAELPAALAATTMAGVTSLLPSSSVVPVSAASTAGVISGLPTGPYGSARRAVPRFSTYMARKKGAEMDRTRYGQKTITVGRDAPEADCS